MSNFVDDLYLAIYQAVTLGERAPDTHIHLAYIAKEMSAPLVDDAFAKTFEKLIYYPNITAEERCDVLVCMWQFADRAGSACFGQLSHAAIKKSLDGIFARTNTSHKTLLDRVHCLELAKRIGFAFPPDGTEKKSEIRPPRPML